MSDVDEPLSPAGAVRRAQIGRMARRAAGRRRLRRAAGRATVVLLVVAGATPLLWRKTSPPRPVVAVRSASAQRPSPAPPPSAVISYVATDRTITDRLSVRPTPPRWVVIDDRQLLDALAGAGRPAGLVSVDGRETLLFRDASSR